MFQQVVHMGLHVPDLSQDLRGGHDTGDRDALVSINVAVDAGEVEENRTQAACKQNQDQAEREDKLLSNGEATDPPAWHGVAYHSRRRGVSA
jgi:hypothetical protein